MAPVNNVAEASGLIDMASTCQCSNEETVLFLGSHSPLSNLYSSNFTIDNRMYNSAEQFIQSEKAATFDDDATQAQILREVNPYKVKKLGLRVKGFRLERWRQVCKQIVYRAVLAKFQQNITLQQLILDSGNKLLVENSMDSYRGTGIHLHNKAALDRKFWKNEGGVMSDILSRVREDLRR